RASASAGRPAEAYNSASSSANSTRWPALASPTRASISGTASAGRPASTYSSASPLRRSGSPVRAYSRSTTATASGYRSANRYACTRSRQAARYPLVFGQGLLQGGHGAVLAVLFGQPPQAQRLPVVRPEDPLRLGDKPFDQLARVLVHRLDGDLGHPPPRPQVRRLVPSGQL